MTLAFLGRLCSCWWGSMRRGPPWCLTLRRVPRSPCPWLMKSGRLPLALESQPVGGLGARCQDGLVAIPPHRTAPGSAALPAAAPAHWRLARDWQGTPQPPPPPQPQSVDRRRNHPPCLPPTHPPGTTVTVTRHRALAEGAVMASTVAAVPRRPLDPNSGSAPAGAARVAGASRPQGVLPGRSGWGTCGRCPPTFVWRPLARPVTSCSAAIRPLQCHAAHDHPRTYMYGALRIGRGQRYVHTFCRNVCVCQWKTGGARRCDETVVAGRWTGERYAHTHPSAKG